MMRTQVQESSLIAYDHLKSTRKLGKQAQTILDKLSVRRDYTLREIQKITGFEINVVSGRVNDLKKLNLLEEVGIKRTCSVTGSLVMPVRLPTATAQKELF